MSALSLLTKNAKRYLSRHVCWLCDQPLDRDECASMYERCTQAEIDERRESCLKAYKPRRKS